MNRKFGVLLVLAVLFAAGQAFLAGCNGDEKDYIEILSPEELSFVACAGGMSTPARLVTYRPPATFTGIMCPYVSATHSSPPWNPYSRYPLCDRFYGCQPQNAEPGTYTGVLRVIYVDAFANVTGCAHARTVNSEATIPAQVAVVDPGSEPFPGFTRNGGEDVNYFHFVVPEGTPGLTTQTLEMVNQGGGTLTWTLSSNQPWLGLDPFDGDTGAEQDAVNVNVNVEGLEAGSIHFGTISVTSDSPDLPAEEIVIVLQVAAP